MSNLKPTTRSLISIAKRRRSTLKRGASSHAEGTPRPKAVASAAEQRYRKSHAEGLKDQRKKFGRKAVIGNILQGMYSR